ncbi:hypothetical protein AAG906_031251 [Vitis piasezkii]
MAGSLQAHEQSGLEKRQWTPREDRKLLSYMEDVPNVAGLNRCRKSCWLRWTKYLKPGIKRGSFLKKKRTSLSSSILRLATKSSSSTQTPLHGVCLISTDPAGPGQTRGFNYQAMENPTVLYNNHAADPGVYSLYGNVPNEGSTPALMVSVENKNFSEDQTGETSNSFGGDTALVQHTSIV